MIGNQHLACFLFIISNFTIGKLMSVHYGQSKGNITLVTNYLERLDEIIWKKYEDIVIQYDDNTVTQYREFKGRTILDKETGDLTITGLRIEDSGLYGVELLSAGFLKNINYKVEIIDAVTKPAVTCQINSSTVTLRCAGDQSPLTEYSWVGPGIQNKPGSELQLNNEDIQNSTVYSCVVKNPVSQKRMEFPIKSCLAQEHFLNIITIVVISLIITIIIIIIIILGLLYLRRDGRSLLFALTGLSSLLACSSITWVIPYYQVGFPGMKKSFL